jgi:hypothetical protein
MKPQVEVVTYCIPPWTASGTVQFDSKTCCLTGVAEMLDDWKS